MTKLGRMIKERQATYGSVAASAHLQPRTVRQLATGETPMDHVAVGTVRRIAAALSVPVGALLEDGGVRPGDETLSRTDRLSAAIREVMWTPRASLYLSPVETGERDEIADVAPDEFFGEMKPIDARGG